MGTTTAYAGNPAFQDDKETKINQTQNLIFNDVHKKLSNLIPLTKEAYVNTTLYSNLHKDYSQVDYPSEIDMEGMVDGMLNNEIILASVKKPMTEPAKIELAELLRFYYFNFTDAEIYQPLSKQAQLDYDKEKANDDILNIDRNLNYFDYIKLIETIYQTPTYTPSVRNSKLVEVENEILTSINRLYGVSTENIRMQSWGPNKNVSIPFKEKKFSYLQLLAAYKRDPNVLMTLEFYSSLIDSLYAIHNYSQALRQGLADVDSGLDTSGYEERIRQSYLPIEQGLIQDVKNVLIRDNLATKAIMDGQQWQQSQLGNLGVTKEVKN